MIENLLGGGGGGTVDTVVAGTGISVDSTDPANPIVSSTVVDTNDAAKVSSNDTTAGYLNGKLVAGTGVSLTENNNGGNETLTIASTVTNTDEVAKVSSNDTTAGYLNGKLVAGSNITLTENNNGGNETLTISATGGTDQFVKVSSLDTTPGYLVNKLLASPAFSYTKIGGGGNEYMYLGAITGFANSISSTSPNATVNASALKAAADSTNADLVIQPKGTGALLAQLPDGATTGGNKRGTQSIDLTLGRANATQVASGNNSIAIGYAATASGNQSTAIGYGARATSTGSFCVALDVGGTDTVGATGQASVCIASGSTGNTSFASGQNSIAMGGDSTKASGAQSTVIGGANNTASGSGSATLGGAVLTASGDYSVATGRSATASQHGMRAHGSWFFAAAADCQEERYIMMRATTDAVQTELSANGAAPAATTRIAIANDSTYTFSALITARRTDADNESAGYKIEGVIDNNAGTTAFAGTPTVTVLNEDTAAWDVVAEADNTNDALVFKVTGEANKTIRWGATVTLMKIAG